MRRRASMLRRGARQRELFHRASPSPATCALTSNTSIRRRPSTCRRAIVVMPSGRPLACCARPARSRRAERKPKACPSLSRTGAVRQNSLVRSRTAGHGRCHRHSSRAHDPARNGRRAGASPYHRRARGNGRSGPPAARVPCSGRPPHQPEARSQAGRARVLSRSSRDGAWPFAPTSSIGWPRRRVCAWHGA